MEQQYLDSPEKDGTKQAHPAWWRGHNVAYANTLKIFTDIILDQADIGQMFKDPNLEKTRRVFLAWKQLLEELATKKTNYMSKHAKRLLLESKQLLNK